MLVSRAIVVAIDEAKASNPDLSEVVVVHGAAKGADALASEFVNKTEDYLRGHGINIYEERHRAKWNQHGSGAGPVRNREMVRAGADICLAFPLEGSKGTWDCIVTARRAGIPVRIYRENKVANSEV